MFVAVLALFIYGRDCDNFFAMAARIVVRLELTKDAKSRLGEISKRTGMTQVSVSSRLFEWFSKQSELIQAAVLGQYPTEIQADVADLILKRMGDRAVAGGGEKKK